MTYLGILFSSIFLTNIMFYHLDGLPTVSKETQEKTIVISGISKIIVGFIATFVIFPINKYLLVDIGWSYLLPLIVVLVTLGATILVNNIINKIIPNSSTEDVSYRFIFMESVIVSAALIVVSSGTFTDSLFQMLGFQIGHFLITFLIFTMRPRLDLPGIPKSFKGIPIILITVGLIAMIFVGLAGIL